MESKSFNLVEGLFNVSDAKEVISNLINSKIKFHNLEILRYQEWGLDERAKSSALKIKELLETKEQILQMLNLKNDADLQVEVSGPLTIKIKENTAHNGKAEKVEVAVR